MLRRKALKKILITSITLLIILMVYLIPNFSNEETIKTNLELEYVSGIGTNSIYLLDKNNYLVKSKILLTENTTLKKINTLINNLIINNSNTFPDSLKATIPKGTKLLNCAYSDSIATINFSKEFLDVDEKLEDRMFESIVYTLLDLEGIKGVRIKVNGEYLGNYPKSKNKLDEILTKDIGINKEYNITKRSDIEKVVIYYVENIDGANYYVPVTKYLNDSRDKVKIIIDNLTTSYIYEPNLMSLLNKDVELTGYEEKENVMFLDFNNSILSDENITEEVVYMVSLSVFDNYNVESVVLTVDDEVVKSVKKSDLI